MDDAPTAVEEESDRQFAKKMSRKEFTSRSPSVSGGSTPDIDDTQLPLADSHRGEPLFIDRRYIKDRDTFEETIVDESEFLEKKSIVDIGHPFVLKRTADRRGYKSVEVKINDPDLKRLLSSKLKDYPGHWDEEKMRFRDFFPIVHNWERLQEAAQNSANAGGKHLKHLLGIIRRSKQFNEYFDSLENNTSTKVVAYKDLTKLFMPGQLVFATPWNLPQAFIVNSDWMFRDYYELNCWTYNFDGEEFRRSPSRFHIREYKGTKAITTLRCYPLDYHEKREEIVEILKARGQIYRHFCFRELGQQMFNYDGDMFFCSERPEDVFGDEYANTILLGSMVRGLAQGARETRPKDDVDDAQFDQARSKIYNYKGRVIVDPASYELYGPKWPRGREKMSGPDEFKECDCSKCAANEPLRKRLKVNYDHFGRDFRGKWREFEEDMQYLICPPRINSYALGKKMWVQLLVDKVSDIKEQEKRNMAAFNNLILPKAGEWKDVKELIRLLVQNHASTSGERQDGVPAQLKDLVEGKGKGLVILLHGASGVGKTLTAEGVAEYTGKPLLKVSVADIGLEITKIEKNLDEMFQLASRWRAVLLFDEADILLEARTDEAQLQRNSMVSVFLKVLEYYEGILLLTTNRIRTFDIAVQSRVHLAVRFPQMEEEEQKEVIRMFLKQIDKHDVDYDDIMEWLEEFPDHKFSGRQIRNILSAATDIARAEGRKLKLKDITRLWNRTKTFKEYLQKQTYLAEKTSL